MDTEIDRPAGPRSPPLGTRRDRTRHQRGRFAAILVIRFGALGDLCLLAWALSRLHAENPATDRPGVTLVTKAGFADLMRQVPGVDDVIVPEDGGLVGLSVLAARLRAGGFDQAVDAHHNLRSGLLLARLRRRAAATLAKDTASRLAFLRFGVRSDKLERTMLQRFDDLFARWRPGGDPAEPGDSDAPLAGRLPPFHRHPLNEVGEDQWLGVAPGAHWSTKRWPSAFFARFLDRWQVETSWPARIFLGPQEEEWFDGSELARTAARLSRVDICRNRSLTETVAQLAACRSLLTNDSGLLHLAEAAGTPVTALFGPTVREFGYFPGLPESQVLQTDWSCRPCSRNGKAPCHRLDKACLVDIGPDRVFEAILTGPPWGPLTTGENRHG